MENIFFLVLVAVVGLLRWAMQAAETKRNAEAQKRSDTPPPNAPIVRAPVQSEEERVRKFFEALGVPSTSAPPPRVQPRTVTSKTAAPRRRKIHPVDPFPIPRAGPAVPPVVVREPLQSPTRQPPAEALPPSIPEVTVIREPSARTTRTAAIFEVRDLDEALLEESPRREGAKKIGDAAPGLAARLATSEGLRDAMVLREIFGAPRSMVSI